MIVLKVFFKDDKELNDLIQELFNKHIFKYRLNIEKAVRNKAFNIYRREILKECRTFII